MVLLNLSEIVNLKNQEKNEDIQEGKKEFEALRVSALY